MGNLTPRLAEARDRIRDIAAEFGLDFYETVFELVDYDELNMVAAYGGFPTRYPHWRFGMEYEELSKSYSYGLSKIYELVINNDPCYAYLMRSNSLVDQKLVMAHVYGHCDFFKNNLWFSKTDRKMMDRMANHATRIRSFIDRFGLERVEEFVDACLSLDNLIDIHAPFIKREAPPPSPEDRDPSRVTVSKIKTDRPYMDRYINPPEYLEAEKKRIMEERARERRFPPEPRKDVLKFLLEYAPLEPWEQDILAMLREEAYYFAPQGQTKIMNEGWAVYWHSKIMTSKVLTDEEVVDYADHTAGTLAMMPGRINPYKIGVELFRDIEDRWNKGRFGKEYEECDDAEKLANWDLHLGLGREKIFEVRRIYNDVSFIDEFLTAEFAERLKLFVYGFNPQTGRMEIVDRDYRKVKEQLIRQLTNFGQPWITVTDGNYENRGELYLVHRWDGVELQLDEALETLKNLYRMWKRPVHIETMLGGKGKLLSYDGSEAGTRDITLSEK